MLFDAHNHLQDERLDPWRDQIIEDIPRARIAEMVVNGSCEADWPMVADLARRHAWVRPAFGLHPWRVKERSPGWLAQLRGWLLAHPRAVVGETGLDRWIENPNVEVQSACFRAQLALAVELDRPVTIHCLHAFGLLEQVLSSVDVPRRGFLLHSYGGPVEMVPRWVELGGYFSVSPYFAHPRKSAQLATFAKIPLHRLLAETDAPDMWPPPDSNPHPLHALDGRALNHPLNLRVSYGLVSKLHEIPVQKVEEVLGRNYRRLFDGLEA